MEPRRTPYGFIIATDHLAWTVVAPEAANYQIAVLFHSGGEDNVGSKLVVSSGSDSVEALVVNVKQGAWQGGPQDRPSFRREWLSGSLRLNKGVNELKLSVIPGAPAGIRGGRFAEAADRMAETQPACFRNRDCPAGGAVEDAAGCAASEEQH